MARADELSDDALDALGARYDTAVSMDWVPELTARYGLEVTL